MDEILPLLLELPEFCRLSNQNIPLLHPAPVSRYPHRWYSHPSRTGYRSRLRHATYFSKLHDIRGSEHRLHPPRPRPGWRGAAYRRRGHRARQAWALRRPLHRILRSAALLRGDPRSWWLPSHCCWWLVPQAHPGALCGALCLCALHPGRTVRGVGELDAAQDHHQGGPLAKAAMLRRHHRRPGRWRPSGALPVCSWRLGHWFLGHAGPSWFPHRCRPLCALLVCSRRAHAEGAPLILFPFWPPPDVGIGLSCLPSPIPSDSFLPCVGRLACSTPPSSSPPLLPLRCQPSCLHCAPSPPPRRCSTATSPTCCSPRGGRCRCSR